MTSWPHWSYRILAVKMSPGLQGGAKEPGAEREGGWGGEGRGSSPWGQEGAKWGSDLICPLPF